MKKAFILYALSLLLLGCTQPQPYVGGRIGTEMDKSAKRGVAYNFPTMDDVMAMSPYISWNYNWGNSIGSNLISVWFDNNDIDYCPMCWSGNYSADAIRKYVALHPNTKYLLAFNEPNLVDQARMTPKEAAALWKPVVDLAKELNLKLVSPAMNYGTLTGYQDPVKWLDEFFNQPGVSLDDIAAISLHCYMGSSVALQAFVDRFDKYGKPIWMTEFCAWENNIGSAAAQMQYMSEVLNYFEQTNKVQRYAWFIPRYKKENTFPYMQLLKDNKSELTDLGKVYCYFSSFDKNVFLKSPLYGGQYIETNDFMVHVAPNTDPIIKNEHVLMLYALGQGQDVTYQIGIEESVDKISLRYASFGVCQMAIYVDGQIAEYISVPATGSTDIWKDYVANVPMKAGQHQLKLQMVSGTAHLSMITW